METVRYNRNMTNSLTAEEYRVFFAKYNDQNTLLGRRAMFACLYSYRNSTGAQKESLKNFLREYNIDVNDRYISSLPISEIFATNMHVLIKKVIRKETEGKELISAMVKKYDYHVNPVSPIMMRHFLENHPQKRKEVQKLAFLIFSRHNGAAFEYLPLLEPGFNENDARETTIDGRDERRQKYRDLQREIADYCISNPIQENEQVNFVGRNGLDISNNNRYSTHISSNYRTVKPYDDTDIVLKGEYNINKLMEIAPTLNEIQFNDLVPHNGRYLPRQNLPQLPALGPDRQGQNYRPIMQDPNLVRPSPHGRIGEYGDNNGTVYIPVSVYEANRGNPNFVYDGRLYGDFVYDGRNRQPSNRQNPPQLPALGPDRQGQNYRPIIQDPDLVRPSPHGRVGVYGDNGTVWIPGSVIDANRGNPNFVHNRYSANNPYAGNGLIPPAMRPLPNLYPVPVFANGQGGPVETSLKKILEANKTRYDSVMGFLANIIEMYVSVNTFRNVRCENIREIFEKIAIIDDDRKKRNDKEYKAEEIARIVDLQSQLGDEVRKYDKVSAENLYSFLKDKSVSTLFKSLPNMESYPHLSSGDIMLNALENEYPNIKALTNINIGSNREGSLLDDWSEYMEKAIPENKRWNSNKRKSPLIPNGIINPEIDNIISTYNIFDTIKEIDRLSNKTRINDVVVEKLHDRLNVLFKELPKNVAIDVLDKIKDNKQFLVKEPYFTNKHIEKLQETLKNQQQSRLPSLLPPTGK